MAATEKHLENVRSISMDNKTVAKEDGDIALGLAIELDAGYTLSPEIERRVRRKIDYILLPLISCTATLSFLDKVSNNYANNVSHPWICVYMIFASIKSKILY